ncbi:MAG: SapC family protein, partial [Sphingomonas sp.]
LGRNCEVPHFVQIVAGEFAPAAATCPIFIAKDGDSGQFYVGAMFGFKRGENLLEAADGTSDAFRPLDLERQGFYVSGEEIAVDPANPRFGAADGEPLFQDGGQPSDGLRAMQRVLAQLKAGVELTDAFIATMMAKKLIEPVDISLSFDDGETLALEGLYTVSLDGLHDLDDKAALDLFRCGYLQLAYCMAGSLRQVPVLARRRNRQLSAEF